MESIINQACYNDAISYIATQLKSSNVPQTIKDLLVEAHQSMTLVNACDTLASVTATVNQYHAQQKYNFYTAVLQIGGTAILIGGSTFILSYWATQYNDSSFFKTLSGIGAGIGFAGVMLCLAAGHVMMINTHGYLS